MDLDTLVRRVGTQENGRRCGGSKKIKLFPAGSYFMLLVLFLVSSCSGSTENTDEEFSSVMLCADPKCQGKTLTAYPAKNPHYLSFKSGLDVTIFAKPADQKTSGAFGQIGTRRGFIPLNLVREEKIVSRALYSVLKNVAVTAGDSSAENLQQLPAETAKSADSVAIPEAKEQLQPDNTSESLSVDVPSATGNIEVAQQINVNELTTDDIQVIKELPLENLPHQTTEPTANKLPEPVTTSAPVVSSEDEAQPALSPVEGITAGSDLADQLKKDLVIDSSPSPVSTENSVEEKKEPVEEKTKPVEEKTKPVEEKKEPVEEKREPDEEKREPDEEKREPEEEKREPVEEKKEPVAPLQNISDSDVKELPGDDAKVVEELPLENIPSHTTEPTAYISLEPLTTPAPVVSTQEEAKPILSPFVGSTAGEDLANLLMQDPRQGSQHIPATVDLVEEKKEPLTPLHNIVPDSEVFNENITSDEESFKDDTVQPVEEAVTTTASPPVEAIALEVVTLSTNSDNPFFESLQVPSPASTENLVEETREPVVPLHNIVPDSEASCEKMPSGEESCKEDAIKPVEEAVTTTASPSREEIPSAVDALEADTLSISSDNPLFEYLSLLQKDALMSHATIVTVIVGLLWIVMMLAKLHFYVKSKEQIQNSQICDLQAALYKLKTERICLKQDLALEKKKIFELESGGLESGQKVASLECAQSNLKKENVNLHANLDALQQQLNDKDDAINESRNTIQQKETENSELKKKLEVQVSENKRLKAVLSETETSVQSVQADNEVLKLTTLELTSALENMNVQREKLGSELEALQEKADGLETDLKSRVAQLDALRQDSESKDNEIESLRETLKHLDCVKKTSQDGGDGDDSLDDEERGADNETNATSSKVTQEQLFDIVKMKSELNSVSKERTELETQLRAALEEKSELAAQINDAQRIKTECESGMAQASKEKEDAVKNLTVLTKYFKEREVELQRELGTQQVSRMQKEEDANSLTGRLQSIQEENLSYKTHLDSMRKELAETERNLKAQLAAMEKRAHENWVVARNAEREVDDLKRDAAYLRQQLTTLANKQNNSRGNDALDSSGSSSMFDFSLMPPPPPPGVDMANFAMSGMPGMPPMPPMPNFMTDAMNSSVGSESGPSSGQWDSIPPPPMPPMFAPPMPNAFDTLGPLPNFAHHPSHSIAGPMAGYQGPPSHHQSYSELPSSHQRWENSSGRDAFSPISHQSQDLRSSRGASPGAAHGSFSSGGQLFSNPPPHWVRPNGTNGVNPAAAANSGPYSSFNNYAAAEDTRSRSDSRNSVSTSKLHQTGL